MGFNLNRARQAAEKQKDKFIPLDLNEGEVQAIFNRCLKTDRTTEIEYSTLFTKDFGYEQTETPVHFDKNGIRENAKLIKYLYGQLNIIHEDSFVVTFENGIIKYDKTVWTKNHGVLLEFFHLGFGACIMSPFVAEGQKAKFVKLEPTLSPKDPAFPEWWEQHKAEWEN